VHGSSCGHENPPRAKFCLECGTALTVECLHCHAELPPNAKFCLECGTDVRGSSVADRVSVADTPHATPDTLPAGERRQLTVLFCDLVGSTEIAARLDPEEWGDIAARY